MSETYEYARIGARLKQLREILRPDLDAAGWAKKHNLNTSRYYMWERGERRIPPEEAENFAELYDLSLDWIYRGKRSGLSETWLKRL